MDQPRKLVAELWAKFRAEVPACCKNHDDREKAAFYEGVSRFHWFLSREFEGTDDECRALVDTVDAELSAWKTANGANDLVNMKPATEMKQ